jgi:hypothetical protein
MEHAVDYALIAALCAVVGLMSFTLLRLFLWMQRPCERGRFEQTGEAVPATVAAQIHRQLDAALAEQRAAHQEEMDVLRRAVTRTRDDGRNLKAGMSETAGTIETRRGLQVPDERVLRPGSEQRPADHPGALVVAQRSRRVADAAQASFVGAGPVLPVAAAAEAPRHRRQRAQEPQRRDPPLRSALINGIEDRPRKSPTPGMQYRSNGSFFYAEMLDRYFAKVRDREGREDEGRRRRVGRQDVLSCVEEEEVY